MEPNNICTKLLANVLRIPHKNLLTNNFKEQDIKVSQYKLTTDMIKAWSKITFYQAKSINDILDAPLWHNSEIRIANKPSKQKIQVMEVINKVKHIYCQVNKKFYTHYQITQKFGDICTYLDPLSIQQAIPKEWLKILKSNLQIPSGQTKIRESLIKTDKYSRLAYDTLLGRMPRLDDKSRNRWEKVLNREISDTCWKRILNTPKRVTLSAKLQVFQYRLTNHAIVTNIHLHKWGMRDNNLCTFCSKNEETNTHLFVKCQVVNKRLWKPLQKWLYHFCYIHLDIREHEILLNEYKNSFPALVNMLILITKQYIYAKRCLKEQLIFTQLISIIETYRTMELLIATKNNCTKKYSDKWSIYDRV